MNKTTLNSQKEKHSMLSLRRATSVALPGLRLHLDFYPRSPCGERQLILPVKFTAWAFLSTLSLRRATNLRVVDGSRSSIISIHALLAESDRAESDQQHSPHNFYPRSPCGERRMIHTQRFCALIFLSTLSLRRATYSGHDQLALLLDFYPRSPCGERRPSAMSSSGREYFYPRSPCGERQLHIDNPSKTIIFLSTLSLRRATIRR